MLVTIEATLETPLAIKLPAATAQALPHLPPVDEPVFSTWLYTLFKLALTSLPSKVNLITASPTCVAIS